MALLRGGGADSICHRQFGATGAPGLPSQRLYLYDRHTALLQEQWHPVMIRAGHHNPAIAIMLALSPLMFAPNVILDFAWIWSYF